MTSYTRDGTVGPWVAEKLACLERYLSAYTTILRKQSEWCRGYYYIDAFAGAGRAKLRKQLRPHGEDRQLPLVNFPDLENDEEAAEYVNGSPRVSLGIPYPFTHYFFIEQDLRRIRELEKLKTEFGDARNISIIKGDANQALKRTFLSSKINWNHYRGIVFLDPFGLQVPWDTIELIAQTKALEAIINFPVGMAIQRLLPRSGELTDRQRNLLTRYFGSPSWQDIIYEDITDLFGDQQIHKIKASGDRLAKWYQSRLKRAFGYGASPRLIRNSQGGHLYYLLFAGPNQTGAKVAQHVLSQGEALR